MIFHLSRLLFSGFLQFKGYSVRGQNNSKYRDELFLLVLDSSLAKDYMLFIFYRKRKAGKLLPREKAPRHHQNEAVHRARQASPLVPSPPQELSPSMILLMGKTSVTFHEDAGCFLAVIQWNFIRSVFHY